MQTAAATDRGLVRPVNEDCVLADAAGGILIVADGMGGHRGGEVASRMAVSTVYRTLRDAGALDPIEALNAAISAANRAVHDEAATQESLRGMGTTIAVALTRGPRLWIAHAGDSRIYLFGPGGLSQLTEDHSLVAQMVARGEVSPDEARRHPLRHVVTRCLGTEPFVALDSREVPWSRGDILLLCSDGLTGMLENSEIADLIRAGEGNLDAVCESLIEAANAAGGRDNVSVVLAQNEE